MVGYLYIYVHDVLFKGPNKEAVWNELRKFASTLSYLGIQDAT